jgi:hypothetical protein
MTGSRFGERDFVGATSKASLSEPLLSLANLSLPAVT